MRKMIRRQPWWMADEENGDELERGRDRGTGWPRGWGHYQLQKREWTPAMDMFDKGNRLVLRAELPGVPREAIDITLEKGILTIRGERKAEEANEDEWLCCERPSGTFYRAIQLPSEVDTEQVTAEHKDGVLTVTLPKLAETQPKKINVSVA